MAIYYKDEFAAPQKIVGARAFVTANGTTVQASFGVSSIEQNATGQFKVNYSTTMPDNTAAVAVLPNNNYAWQSWYDTNETGRVGLNFFDGGWRTPSKWSAMIIR